MTRDEMLQELQEMKDDDLELAVKAGRASKKTREEGFYFLHHFFEEQRGYEDNKPKIAIPLYNHLKNPLGIAHGGVTAFLADNAMGYASFMASKNWGVTVDMHVRYHRPGQGKMLIATSELLSKGSTFNSTRADIHDDNGKLVASATGTFYFRPQDQHR